MKCYKIMAFLLIIFLFGTQSLVSQSEIISAETFKDMMKENPELVIIDANKTKGYKAAHLKDAIHLNHNDLYKEGDIAGLLKEPAELATILGEHGIGDNKTIVLTDDGSQKYSSRLFWILEYLGYDNVLILHKDKKLWRNARLSQTSKPGKATPASFVPKVRSEIMATMEEVETSMSNNDIVLIDARTAEEFSGNHKKSDGHIPQAINLNYEDLLTSTGAFKSAEELQAIADNLELTRDKELIFYCKTSIRAGVSYYAFKKILGYENIKVYDGAYNEWFAKREVVQ